MRTVALGEVASINPRGESVAAASLVSFVGMADLDARQGVAHPFETRSFSQVSNGYTIFRDGDILAAKITPCWENGKVGQAQLEHPIGVGSTEFHVLRPARELHDRYLFHFLRQPIVRAAGELRMTGSAGQKRIPASFLHALQIPLPPLPEQRRIAAILDHADALRTKRRQVLTHLESLTAAVFNSRIREVRDYARLNEIGVDFQSGKNVLGQELAAHPLNRVIKVSAISSGTFDPTESKPMPAEYRPPDLHRLHKGDILFGRASGSLDLLGATAVVDCPVEDMYLPDKVWRLSVAPAAPVIPTYVLGLLRSGIVKDFVRHNASGAAGVRNIGKARLLQCEVPVPSLDLQRDLAAELSGISEQGNISQQALSVAAELFTSLQARAFRGDL